MSIKESIVKKIETITGRKMFFFPKSVNVPVTAVRSSLGFWYAGNLFDKSDIAYGIARNGMVEKYETELVIQILRQISKSSEVNFYDVGANTGYYGILAAHFGTSINQTIQSFSFEPLPEYVECIKESIKLNRLENTVTVYETALGNKEGPKQFFVNGLGSSLNKDFIGHYKKIIEVEVDTLDSWVMKNNIPLPSFIKIDTEGHEHKILEGGLDTINKATPVLFIEIAYTLRSIGRNFRNQSFESTFTMLEDIGYEPYYLQRDRLMIFDYKKRPDGIHMYLFLHKTKHFSLIKALGN